MLDEWQTWTFQLNEPTSGPGIPDGTPHERSDLNFFAIGIGGLGHTVEGTFYIRNFIFGGDDDNGDQDIIYGDGVADIDGNDYITVIIGNQEWMAENLRVTRYNNEDDITTGLNDEDWGSTTSGAYAIYNNNDDMLEAYGKLYNWYAVDDTRGLCPEGWSVPSDADWQALVNYVVSEGFTNESGNPNGAGNALKSCRQVGHPDGGDCDTSEHPRWNSHGTHSGLDEFGFSAFPGGTRCTSMGYYGHGDYGRWWSSSEYSSAHAWLRNVSSYLGNVFRYANYKRVGLFVRCIKD